MSWLKGKLGEQQGIHQPNLGGVLQILLEQFFWEWSKDHLPAIL